MTTPTLTYRALGFTDEVTTCEHCGRTYLKGTVRMVLQDQDGGHEGETYMGVVCAARMAGRPAKEIRAEAKQADRERFDAIRAVYYDWRDRHTTWLIALRDAALGRDFAWADWQALRDSAAFKAAEAGWLTANPAPPTPWASRPAAGV